MNQKPFSDSRRRHLLAHVADARHGLADALQGLLGLGDLAVGLFRLLSGLCGRLLRLLRGGFGRGCRKPFCSRLLLGLQGGLMFTLSPLFRLKGIKIGRSLLQAVHFGFVEIVNGEVARNTQQQQGNNPVLRNLPCTFFLGHGLYPVG